MPSQTPTGKTPLPSRGTAFFFCVPAEESCCKVAGRPGATAHAIGGTGPFLTGCRVHFLVLKEIRRNAQEVDTAGPSADQPHTRLLAAPRNGRPPHCTGGGRAIYRNPPWQTRYTALPPATRSAPFPGTDSCTNWPGMTGSSLRWPWSRTPARMHSRSPPRKTEQRAQTCLYQLKFADGAAVPVPLSRESSLTVKDSFTTTASPTACEEFSESF